MNRLIAYLRRYRDNTKHVRPWALAVPILVLLVCLPLLRPLRHPGNVSDDEVARLATVQALVERRTQAIDFTTFKPDRNVIRVGGAYYSSQPPAFAVVLAGAYWSMHQYGVTFATNPSMVAYLLTVLGTTLPVAAIAGMVYRMGRLFELARPWRTALAGGVVVGGGVLAYATVLNEHVPAAALVMAGAACVIHIVISKRRLSAGVWLAACGFCVALAATFDPTAAIYVPLFIGVILSLPWKRRVRLGGLALYALGLIPPLALHLALTIPVTGDWRPGFLHPELSANLSPEPPAASLDDWDDDLTDGGYWNAIGHNVARVGATLLGDHGLLSHFPVLAFGMVGMMMVMHRHWPTSAKVLAASSGGTALVVMLIYALSRPHWADAAFAVRWFVVFMPLLMFWAGAWLRRPHRPLGWAFAGVLLTFSLIVSLIGATGPLPPGGFTGYTASDALDRLFHTPTPNENRDQLANRRPR